MSNNPIFPRKPCSNNYVWRNLQKFSQITNRWLIPETPALKILPCTWKINNYLFGTGSNYPQINVYFFAFAISLLHSFSFFFFPQLPTLVSMPLSPPTALGGSALPLILQKQATHGTQSMGFFSPNLHHYLRHPRWKAGVHSYSSFYFPLIDMSLFKDRVVAMGKPHCNYSICNLGEQKGSGLFFGSESEPSIEYVKCWKRDLTPFVQRSVVILLLPSV